jgi:hypothetical protein
MIDTLEELYVTWAGFWNNDHKSLRFPQTLIRSAIFTVNPIFISVYGKELV